MGVPTTEAQRKENRAETSGAQPHSKEKNKRQQIQDKEVLSTLTRLSGPFTGFQQQTSPPADPGDTVLLT